MELQENEQYLTISLFGGQIKLSAFINKDRTNNPKAPHFKGDGVAVWVNRKKKKVVEELIEPINYDDYRLVRDSDEEDKL